MYYWSLLTEVIALLINTVLFLSLTGCRQTTGHALKMYRACLATSGFTIICNMACVILLRFPDVIPRGVNIFMNSMYLLMEVLLCAMIALFIFEKMLEHVYEQFCIVRARVMLITLTSLYALLVLVNIRTGVLFWIDAQGGYHRGILNLAGYGIMAAEMVLLFVCYVKHHLSVGREMVHALTIFPPIVIGLVVIQVFYRDLLLNGTIATLVNIILFISFFSNNRENDSVTGIGNRDSFFSELSLRIAGRQHFQIILVFPKEFSAVNRKYGYQIGNEFLYSMAGWIEHKFEEAVAFRYIGVAFAVILPFAEEEKAESYVKAFMDRFKEPWIVGWRKEMLSASFTDLVYTGGYIEANEMMEILDYMLSLAKHSGQNYIRYDEKVAVNFLQKRRIKECLKKAIDEETFEVWYQPVYSADSQRFSSAEALVRLKDNGGKYIPPDRFIPIAEEMGEVGEIFWQVLKSVCRFIKNHPDLPLDTISVNMSIEQFAKPDFSEKIRNILNEWQVEPEKLRFEITERAISADAAHAGEVIRKMELDGFRFYLDDFGIGYSNFAAVSQYHFECVKLDKSLVDVVGHEEKGGKMVQKLIKLFHEMEMKVIVEGAETQEQVCRLMELKADRIQGYYYARPMPEMELVEYLIHTS